MRWHWSRAELLKLMDYLADADYWADHAERTTY